jgi:hypothetical protein
VVIVILILAAIFLFFYRHLRRTKPQLSADEQE